MKFPKKNKGKEEAIIKRSVNMEKAEGTSKKGRIEDKEKPSTSSGQCFICKKPGHESKECCFRCTRCKIPNHFKRNCWYRDKQVKNDMNFVKGSQEDQLFILA